MGVDNKVEVDTPLSRGTLMWKRSEQNTEHHRQYTAKEVKLADKQNSSSLDRLATLAFSVDHRRLV